MISVWSVLSGTLWFSAAMLTLHLLRRRTGFLMKYGTNVFVVAVALACMRILLPLDSKYAFVVNSYKVLPELNSILKYDLYHGISVTAALLGIWCLGGVIMLFVMLWHAIQDFHRVKNFTLTASEQVHRVCGQMGLNLKLAVITSAVKSPVTIGLITHKIYLPDISYSDVDLYWILCHEKMHIRQKHIWLKLLYRLLCCVFWWNPIVHWAQKDIDNILELRCDQAVLLHNGEAERIEYVETLHHVAKQIHDQQTYPFTSAVTFIPSPNANVLAQRAYMVFRQPTHSIKGELAVLMAGLLLLVASYLIIFQPAGFPPADEINGAIMITPETSYLVQIGPDKFELWHNGVYFTTIQGDTANSPPHNSLEVRK